MTELCGNCAAYIATPGQPMDGVCRLHPPTGGNWTQPVMDDWWCQEFNTKFLRGSQNVVAIAYTANATNTFAMALKGDGTMWLSINNGASWSPIPSP